MEWTAGQGIQDPLHGNQEREGAGGAMSTPESHPNMKSGPPGYQNLVLKFRRSLIKSLSKDYQLLSVQGSTSSLENKKKSRDLHIKTGFYSIVVDDY